MKSFRKYLAEFIGTFVLVFIGCGTAAALGCNGASPDVAYFATAAAFGLTIIAEAYSIGNVSGCHVNPAVSLAMAVSGRMKWKDFCGYVIAQIAGGFLGAALLIPLVGVDSGLGSNSTASFGTGTSFLVELILTFIFVLTIMGATAKKEYSSTAGIVIGATLFMVHIIGIHFTGTSVNPARSIAPAVLSGNTHGLWVFIVAPLLGGLIAAAVYSIIDPKKKKAAESETVTPIKKKKAK